jgi:hypothetical protein
VRITLPVEELTLGWVIVPITGVDGVAGAEGIMTFDDKSETHPEALVTVKLYCPEGIPDMVVEPPVPLEDTVPG